MKIINSRNKSKKYWNSLQKKLPFYRGNFGTELGDLYH